MNCANQSSHRFGGASTEINRGAFWAVLCSVAIRLQFDCSEVAARIAVELQWCCSIRLASGRRTLIRHWFMAVSDWQLSSSSSQTRSKYRWIISSGYYLGDILQHSHCESVPFDRQHSRGSVTESRCKIFFGYRYS